MQLKRERAAISSLRELISLYPAARKDVRQVGQALLGRKACDGMKVKARLPRSFLI